jgi:integrase
VLVGIKMCKGPIGGDDDTEDLLQHYIGQSRAPNTTRTYLAQWQAFQIWCTNKSRVYAPATPETVALYLAERAQAGAAPSSIAVALAAIQFAHDRNGIPLQREHPLLRLILDGIRRAHLRPQRQAEPLRRDLLDGILRTCGATAVEQRDGALLALLFLFALRASEVVALDWMSVGEGSGWLLIKDDVLEVGLCGSKATGQGVERLLVPAQICPCALRTIQSWADLTQARQGQPVLRALARGGAIRPDRLHTNSVSGIVKAAVARHLVRCGASPGPARAEAGRFSGHSGRVGLYVSATEAGVPAQHIAALARHKSMAMVLRYAW